MIPVTELREILAKLPDDAQIGCCVVHRAKAVSSVIVMADVPTTFEKYTDLWGWRLNK